MRGCHQLGWATSSFGSTIVVESAAAVDCVEALTTAQSKTAVVSGDRRGKPSRHHRPGDQMASDTPEPTDR